MTYRARCDLRRERTMKPATRLRRDTRGRDLDAMTLMKMIWPSESIYKLAYGPDGIDLFTIFSAPWWLQLALERHWIGQAEFLRELGSLGLAESFE